LVITKDFMAQALSPNETAFLAAATAHAAKLQATPFPKEELTKLAEQQEQLETEHNNAPHGTDHAVAGLHLAAGIVGFLPLGVNNIVAVAIGGIATAVDTAGSIVHGDTAKHIAATAVGGLADAGVNAVPGSFLVKKAVGIAAGKAISQATGGAIGGADDRTQAEIITGLVGIVHTPDAGAPTGLPSVPTVAIVAENTGRHDR